MPLFPPFGRDFSRTMDAQKARGYEVEKLNGGLFAQVKSWRRSLCRSPSTPLPAVKISLTPWICVPSAWGRAPGWRSSPTVSATAGSSSLALHFSLLHLHFHWWALASSGFPHSSYKNIKHEPSVFTDGFLVRSILKICRCLCYSSSVPIILGKRRVDPSSKAPAIEIDNGSEIRNP